MQVELASVILFGMWSVMLNFDGSHLRSWQICQLIVVVCVGNGFLRRISKVFLFRCVRELGVLEI